MDQTKSDDAEPAVRSPGSLKVDLITNFSMRDCCIKCWDELEAPLRSCRPFIICTECGNERCPKATDHNLACTKSNEPGQAGSAFGGQGDRTGEATAKDSA